MTASPLVLFVDPDPSWSRSLRAGLHIRGARTATVSSEQELYRHAQGPPPTACVLADSMVDAGGEPMKPLLTEVFPGTPIISAASPTPADRERHRVEAAIDRLLQGRLAGPPKRRPIILCVDDDTFYLTSLARLLGRRGFSVATYGDPERALEAVPELEPDLAIVDILMPGMSGLDLTAELRANARPVPVIVLSALATDADVLRAHRRGAQSYLTKPCDPAGLFEAIDRLVGSPDRREGASMDSSH